MSWIRAANLALRFILELCALAALAYWGYRTGGSGPGRLALAVVAPLLAAVAWGLFVAPKARFKVSEAVRLAVELLVFAAAIAGLAAAGRPALAWTFAILVLVNSSSVRARRDL